LLDRQSAVHLHGKGRQERVIPFRAIHLTGLVQVRVLSMADRLGGGPWSVGVRAGRAG